MQKYTIKELGPLLIKVGKAIKTFEKQGVPFSSLFFANHNGMSHNTLWYQTGLLKDMGYLETVGTSRRLTLTAKGHRYLKNNS